VEAVAAADVEVAVDKMLSKSKDRVGLGWRPDLAAGIFDHLDRIDLLEVIADDFFSAPQRQIRSLKTLASQVPVVLHGIGLGLASSAPVETKCLDQMARLVDQVRPESWSEHLAFVRAGGIELGHLAAPPRSSASVDAVAENLRRAELAVGSKPHVENIATLIDPPASLLSESEWINGILAASHCDLLLDLHNVLANGLNHGYDPLAFVRQIPPDRIAAIHIAGGKFVTAPDGSQRLLDDHFHDVPDPVFDLLEETAARAPRPLTVILERDGDYPSVDSLLAQIVQARQALARGRARSLQPIEAVA
jgi:uncharacterized protein (UPF0276 family)